MMHAQKYKYKHLHAHAQSFPISEGIRHVMLQEESAQLQRQLSAEHERSKVLQEDLSVSLRDSKEALFREKEIISQLEAQDEVTPPLQMQQRLLHPPYAPPLALHLQNHCIDRLCASG